MVRPVLLALTLATGAIGTAAGAQVRIIVDGQVQELPPGVARTISIGPDGRLVISDQPLTTQFIPGAVTVTTVETIEGDEHGHSVQTAYETRIGPVAAAGYTLQPQAAVAYAPQLQPAVAFAPAEAAVPAPHLELDLAALAFPEPGASSPQILRIARDRQTGHFIAPIRVNGVAIRAIIDTGAQETILSAQDARATGANRDVVRSEEMAGIGGYTRLDVTRLRSMEVAGQDLGGFTAAIGQQGIPYTLLGQTEIARLGRIEIEDGVMTITPRESLIALR